MQLGMASLPTTQRWQMGPLARVRVACGLVALGCVVCGTVGAQPAGAATLFVAPAGSGASCEDHDPCGSLDEAYRAASPGDTVEVAPGSYGSQEVDKDPGKPPGSPAVTFQAAGAILSGFTTHASDVHYVDLHVTSSTAFVKAGRNVTLRGLTVERFDIAGPSSSTPAGDKVENVTVVAGDFDLVDCAGDAHVVGPARNVKVLDSRFFDHRTPAGCPGKHLDCLHTFNGIDGLTVARNTFAGCAHMGVLINGSSNILVENNFLQGGIYGFKLRSGPVESGDGEVFDNVTIRHNSADHIALGTEGSNSLSNVLVEANATLEGVSCRSGTAYLHNLAQSGSNCGPDDIPNDDRHPIGFADPDSGDFRIELSSPAVDRLAAGPQSDVDGDTRPQGGGYDIGAHEVEQPTDPDDDPPPDEDPPDEEPPPDDGPGEAPACSDPTGPWSPLCAPLPNGDDPAHRPADGDSGGSRAGRVSLRRVSRRVAVSRRGRVRLRLRCVRAGSANGKRRCAGLTTLVARGATERRRGRRLGRRRFSIRAGRTATVRLRLNRRGRRATWKRRLVAAELRIVGRRAGSAMVVASKRVRLHRTSGSRARLRGRGRPRHGHRGSSSTREHPPSTGESPRSTGPGAGTAGS